jgi:hypothetical protein
MGCRMMLNIRELLFNPTKYIREFAIGIEESHTTGDASNSHELLHISARNQRNQQRSAIKFAHSTITNTSQTESWLREPGILSISRDEEWQGPSTPLGSGPDGSFRLSTLLHPNQVNAADDADSGHIVFASATSTPELSVRPLRTIHEGGSDSVLPSPVDR